MTATLLGAAVTQSWLTMTSIVAGLGAGLALTLVELRRTRAALRGLHQRVERTDQRLMKLVAKDKAVSRNLRQLERTQANLRNGYTRMATSLYDAHRRTHGPFDIEMHVGQVLPTARGLVGRGDVLDAHALLVVNNSLHRQDANTLRTLRGELKKRGYLGKSLEVARVLTALENDDRDLQMRRMIEGEIAVLSGDFTPTVQQERERFQPRENRVLHFVGTSLPTMQTGYTLRTHYTALAQQKAGLDPHVATQMGFGHDGEDYKAEDIEGITYHYIPGPARNVEPLGVWMRKNVQRLANLVRVVRPVAIHAASDYLNALAANVVGKEFGIPVIYESRGFWEETWLSRQAQTYQWDDLDALEATYGLPDVYTWRCEIEDRCRRDVTHVVTLDDVMAERIATGGVPRDRITVVPNAVDVDRFPVLERNSELATKLGFDENMPVMGYISSIVEYEGIDTLIDAYASVKASVDARVGLLIVGDGPVLKRLKKQADDLELADVVFIGRVPHDEVLDYYSVIDIFVVPRRPVDVCHLVTPLKPFEAFSTGRTLVLSDVRALASIATTSNAAELFTAGDSESLATVLAKLLDDPERRRQLAGDGAAWVRSSRTWDSNATTYVRLYENLGVIPAGQLSIARLRRDDIDLDYVRRQLAERVKIPFERLGTSDGHGNAEKIINSGWRLGSHPPVELELPLDWRTLCMSNRSWNFHLHAWDFMEPVLRAFDATGEQRYLHWCIARAESWALEFNEGGAGETLAWYDMALGLRGARLAYLVEQALKHGVNPEIVDTLLTAVMRHQREFHSTEAFNPRSNHGVYVALGQLALARRLAGLPAMDVIAAQGRERLESMIKQQFAADGGHLEHSPDYHRMVLGTFVGALDAGLVSSDELRSRLADAGEILGWLVQPNGELVQIGDSPALPMMSTRSRSSSDTTEFVISHGARGMPDDRTLRILPETGYAIVRSPQPADTDDHDSAGYLFLNAAFHSRTHKHADDLTITWSDRGTEILIDAGRYGYVDLLSKDSPLRHEGYFYGSPERQYVESTRAHNTLEVDGRDHNRRTRKPYGSAIEHAEEKDGFYRLDAAVDHGSWIHDRSIIYRPQEWLLIRDSARAKDGRAHDFRTWWNMPHELNLRKVGQDAICVVGNGLDVPLWVVEFSGSVLIDPVAGQSDPMRGWRSKHDLEFTPAWSCGYLAAGRHEHEFVTLFSFSVGLPRDVPDHPFD